MKKLKWLGLVLALVLCFSIFAACDNSKTHKVTFYDGETVLKTVEVKDGEKAASYTPEKEGYKFDGWFATPNFAHEFDFDAAITEDASVFSKWSSTAAVEDTREFYICGIGSSPALGGSNKLEEAGKMTKTADKNEYTLTVDLFANDWFQFVTNTSWNYQHGWGYMSSGSIGGVEYFASNGSIDGSKPTKMEDIVCKKDGNYTFTLTTHPADDLGKPTELSASDTITFTYNGEVQSQVEAVVHYYIKGAQITAWQDMRNPATELKETDTKGVYSMSVYLKANDQFMFASTFVTGTEVAVGNLYIKADALEATTYVDGTTGNMTAKADGTYTFTYTKETNKLAVAFDATKTPAAADYYLDGNYGEGNWTGYNFNASAQLKEKVAGSGVYVIEGVQLTAGKEFTIQAFKAGSTEPGEGWSNHVGNYNFLYLRDVGDAFVPANPATGNNNFKVVTSGTYNISIDSYSKIVEIKDANAGLDIYIKGANINGWDHKFAAEWKFTLSADKLSYEFVLVVEADKEVEFGFAKYNEGATSGNGDWLGLSAIGSTGDANATFTPASGGNFKCSTAGTYKIVYNIETGLIDFYAVSAE